MAEIAPGDTVFWHDPDDDLCSGVGTVAEILGGVYRLTMQGGGETEARPSELTRVGEDDVVGVNEAGFLLYYSDSFDFPYSDGVTTEKTEHCLDDEERRRVAAIRKRLGNT